VFAFDQHAQPPDGIAVDFFGTPAWTFKSLAIIALATGAPVVPATSWREPDGRHVLRFEAPIPAVEHANTSEAIRLTTRAYNAALERSCCAARAVVLGASALEDRRSTGAAAQAADGQRMTDAERSAVLAAVMSASCRGRRRSSTATSRGRCSSTSAAASGTSSTGS
jgi:hypothetical protein